MAESTTSNLATATTILMISVLGGSGLRGYFRRFGESNVQLGAFSLAHAKAFCCTVNHVDISGEKMIPVFTWSFLLWMCIVCLMQILPKSEYLQNYCPCIHTKHAVFIKRNHPANGPECLDNQPPGLFQMVLPPGARTNKDLRPRDHHKVRAKLVCLGGRIRGSSARSSLQAPDAAQLSSLLLITSYGSQEHTGRSRNTYIQPCVRS